MQTKPQVVVHPSSQPPQHSGYRQRDRQTMFFPRYFKFSSQDMAIDLGTANTVVYLRGRGIVLNEPSVVAIETQYGIRRVKAVGNDAKLMMGKKPDNIETSRPLRDGVLAAISVAEQMIQYFIKKEHGGPGRMPRTRR